MKLILLRTTAIVLHAIITVILVSMAMNYDITGTWIGFFLYAGGCLILFGLFLFHIISFLKFIKTR